MLYQFISREAEVGSPYVIGATLTEEQMAELSPLEISRCTLPHPGISRVPAGVVYYHATGKALEYIRVYGSTFGLPAPVEDFNT